MLKAYELNHELAIFLSLGTKDEVLSKQVISERSAEFKKNHEKLFTTSLEDALDNDFDSDPH